LIDIGSDSSPSVPRFDVKVEDGEVALMVRVTGEVDICTAPRLTAVLAAAIAAGGQAARVVVELSEVSFLGVRGLDALVEGRGWAVSNGKRLVLANPSSMTCKMLRLCRLEEVLPVLEET
jgi:anti-anti-sigma factor